MQVQSVFWQGLLFGLALFATVGPKDSFLIRQTLIGRYVLELVFICVAADCLLIALGVLGGGVLVEQSPILLKLAVWGGAAYMIFYGISSLLTAIRNQSMPAQDRGSEISFKAVCLAGLSLSLLNPYALIDTLLVIGSLSASQPESKRWSFAAGTMFGSLLWFITLALGTAFLRPVFQKPLMWRLLDTAVGLLMFYLAGWLLLSNQLAG